MTLHAAKAGIYNHKYLIKLNFMFNCVSLPFAGLGSFTHVINMKYSAAHIQYSKTFFTVAV